MFEFVSALVALFLLLAIAFPNLIVPQIKGKKKKVGSAYWGVYEGTALSDTGEGRVEIPTPTRKIHITAGSGMYASGKGISRTK
jgi:hypothetical protein